jgi:hypothetical protein
MRNKETESKLVDQFEDISRKERQGMKAQGYNYAG